MVENFNISLRMLACEWLSGELTIKTYPGPTKKYKLYYNKDKILKIVAYINKAPR